MLSRRPACIGAVYKQVSYSGSGMVVALSPNAEPLQPHQRDPRFIPLQHRYRSRPPLHVNTLGDAVRWQVVLRRPRRGAHPRAGLGRATLAVEDLNIDAMRLYRRRGYVVCGAEDSEWDQQAPDGTTYRYRCRCLLMQRALKPA